MSHQMLTALILVDLQHDFLNRPDLEPHPASVIAGASGWLENYRKDGRPVAHLFTRVSRRDDRRMQHWKKNDQWLCEENQPGESPPQCLAPRLGEAVFYKHGYLHSTPAEIVSWLRDTGISHVVLAGTMSHACVAYLAVTLLSEGFNVLWAAGALGSDRPQAAAHALSHLAGKGVHETFLGALPENTSANDRVDKALKAARLAWDNTPEAWTTTREALLTWAKLLDEAVDTLAREITLAIGKPISMSRDEVRYAAASVRDVVRWRDDFTAERKAAGGISARRPLGVIGVLTPWNNPVSIAVGRLAPALAFGNAVVWKPAPAASNLSLKIHALALQAGLRADFLNICIGDSDTGRRLVWHHATDAVTFSGSLARGRLVLATASERLIPCQIEMGGNNAAVINDDADVEAAVDAVLAGAFGFAGQRCTANRRVILLPGIRDAFLSLAHERLEKWSPQDPFSDACKIGPVKDTDAVVRIEALLARASRDGAKVLRAPAGSPLTPADPSVPALAFVSPALVTGAAEDSEIVREETFGPVLVVQEASDWNDALRLLNAVPQGLVASLFSRSTERWETFKTKARAGILRQNSATAGALDDLPFGGWKASGWGVAEHAEADALFFTRHQAWVQR